MWARVNQFSQFLRGPCTAHETHIFLFAVGTGIVGSFVREFIDEPVDRAVTAFIDGRDLTVIRIGRATFRPDEHPAVSAARMITCGSAIAASAMLSAKRPTTSCGARLMLSGGSYAMFLVGINAYKRLSTAETDAKAKAKAAAQAEAVTVTAAQDVVSTQSFNLFNWVKLTVTRTVAPNDDNTSTVTHKFALDSTDKHEANDS